MKKLYFILVVGFMLSSVFMVLYFGISPRPVSIMKASYFSQPEEIGAVVFRAFYDPISREQVVFLGTPPQPAFHKQVVEGFLRAAAAEKQPFNIVMADPILPALENVPVKEIVKYELNVEDQETSLKILNDHLAKGEKILVYTPSVYSTHLVFNNPIRRLEALTKKHYFTITSAGMVTQAKDEYLVDPICVGDQRDQQGTADLGCTILTIGRTLYRKHLANDRYVSVLNQHGLGDYLLLTAAPGQGDHTTPGRRTGSM